ncbi:MAG: hypothetical protein LBV55_03660 [Acholeplasmatales bacterium]|nr:hypothetical protein [Acholeplasmatales bacterium]
MVDTIAPDITINVGDGAYTIVLSSANEEGLNYVLYKDGQVVDIIFDTKIREIGEYQLEVTDRAGNVGIFNWKIEKVSNIWTIILIVVGVVIVLGGVGWFVKMKFGKRIK